MIFAIVVQAFRVCFVCVERTFKAAQRYHIQDIVFVHSTSPFQNYFGFKTVEAGFRLNQLEPFSV